MNANLPIYPGHCGRGEPCMSIPLFHARERYAFEACKSPWTCRRPRPEPQCQAPVPVRLTNPCDPDEEATVYLSVDACGNLRICIHREPETCLPRRPACRFDHPLC